MQLVIDPGGVVRCLYEEAIDLSALGAVSIRRASHVEPTTTGSGTPTSRRPTARRWARSAAFRGIGRRTRLAGGTPAVPPPYPVRNDAGPVSLSPDDPDRRRQTPSPGGIVRRPEKGGPWPATSSRTSSTSRCSCLADLPSEDLSAVNRTLGNAGFVAALRRAVRQAVRQFPSLNQVRVRVCRVEATRPPRPSLIHPPKETNPMPPTAAEDRVRARNLLFMGKPTLWPAWPFLPLVRRRPGREEECGLLYDAFNMSDKTGYSATVILCNLFCVPTDEAELLALPQETFDSPEEVYAGRLADRLTTAVATRIPRPSSPPIIPPESEVTALIELTRALARAYRTVLRRSLMEQGPRHDWPLLLCKAGDGGLTLQAVQGEMALRFHQPGARPPDLLAFRAHVLAEFEGRTDAPVVLEHVAAGKGRAAGTTPACRACWTSIP